MMPLATKVAITPEKGSNFFSTTRTVETRAFIHFQDERWLIPEKKLHFTKGPE